MLNQEHSKLHVNDFNLSEFLRLHYNDFIVFASGSWEYTTHTGSYHYATFYEGHVVARSSELHDLKSSDAAMLFALKDACEHIHIKEKNIFLLTPTRLGFHMAQKGKGANVNLVNDIIDICNQKALNINTLAIIGGSELFKEVRRRFQPKTH